MSKIRYEIEVKGAKGFLSPLTFVVTDEALSYVFLPRPKYFTAGGVLVNKLWVRGSKTLQEKGINYDEACLYASRIVNALSQTYSMSEGKFSTTIEDKTFVYDLEEDIDREVLEEAFGILAPNEGVSKPLSAGFEILKSNLKDKKKLAEVLKNEELRVRMSYACYELMKFKGGGLKNV